MECSRDRTWDAEFLDEDKSLARVGYTNKRDTIKSKFLIRSRKASHPIVAMRNTACDET